MMDASKVTNNQMKYKVSKDYRVWILLKYIYVGGADVCFWWTVWNVADHLWPMDITKDGPLSYLRGYVLILGGNFVYLFIRRIFNEMFQKYYERREKFVYPAVIVTKEEVIKEKPSKYKILIPFLQLCVYSLVAGYIMIWRGLFATFDYIVELMYIHLSMNRILSCILFQFVAWVTLAFTQVNNAINLCPTHKIYKYDVIQELDGLFNLHVFDNFHHNNYEGHNFEDTTEEPYLGFEVRNNTNGNAGHNTNKAKNPNDFKPLHYRFDLVQFVVQKIWIWIHSMHEKQKVNQADTSNQLIFENEIAKNSLYLNKRSAHENMFSVNNFFNGNRENDLTVTANVSKGFNEKLENEYKQDSFDIILTVDEEITKIENRNSSLSIHCTVFREADNVLSNCCKNNKYGLKAVTEATRTKMKDFKNHASYHVIRFIAYILTIHHRQIFLHVFGGMFWSTTWKLFDFATQSIFTRTAKDIPVLALIAITCLCLNHLVLFRFKETASGVYMKTFFEFFCGLFTVWLWAPTWYIYDIIATASGYWFLLCVIFLLIFSTPLKPYILQLVYKSTVPFD